MRACLPFKLEAYAMRDNIAGGPQQLKAEAKSGIEY